MRRMTVAIRLCAHAFTGGHALLAGISGFLILALAVVIVYEAVARRAANVASAWTVEVAEVLMVAIVMLPLAAISAKRKHIVLDLLFHRLSPRWQTVTRSITLAASVVFLCLLTWKSWEFAWFAQEKHLRSEGPAAFPLFPARAIVPVGALYLALQLVQELWGAVRAGLAKTGHSPHGTRRE